MRLAARGDVGYQPRRHGAGLAQDFSGLWSDAGQEREHARHGRLRVTQKSESHTVDVRPFGVFGDSSDDTDRQRHSGQALRTCPSFNNGLRARWEGFGAAVREQAPTMRGDPRRASHFLEQVVIWGSRASTSLAKCRNAGFPREKNSSARDQALRARGPVQAERLGYVV